MIGPKQGRHSNSDIVTAVDAAAMSRTRNKVAIQSPFSKYARPKHHTRLAKMGFDIILDLTAVVFLTL